MNRNVFHFTVTNSLTVHTSLIVHANFHEVYLHGIVAEEYQQQNGTAMLMNIPVLQGKLSVAKFAVNSFNTCSAAFYCLSFEILLENLVPPFHSVFTSTPLISCMLSYGRERHFTQLLT